MDYFDRTCPRAGVQGLHILHSNAPAHRSALVIKYLEERSNITLSYPAYSPDLSPCDLWLNPYIKTCLQGRRFERLGWLYFPVTKQFLKRCLQKCILKDWKIESEAIILSTQKHLLKLIVNFTLLTCVYLNRCEIKWQNRWDAGTTRRFFYEMCVKESFMCSCGQTETIKYFLVLDKLAF